MARIIKISESRMRAIDRFCRWFHKNEVALQDAYYNIDANDMIWSALSRRMSYISRSLGYELLCDNDNLKIIFTADGHKRLYPVITELVERFPALTIWKVQALMQPIKDLSPYINGTDLPFEYEDLEIRISDIMFYPVEFDTARRKITLKLYLPHYKVHFDNDTLPEAVRLTIQMLVGEVVFFQYIKEIELAQLPDKTNGLVDLYKLPELLHSFHNDSRKNSNEIGRLLK